MNPVRTCLPKENVMKTFLGVAACLSWVSGLALMFATSSFYGPFGIEVTDKIALIAQAEAAVLIGLGVITWLARRMDRFGQTAVIAGNLVVQVLSLAVIVRAAVLGTVSGTTPGIAMHSILTVAFALCLTRVLGRAPR
jgi:hypothetical protein